MTSDRATRPRLGGAGYPAQPQQRSGDALLFLGVGGLAGGAWWWMHRSAATSPGGGTSGCLSGQPAGVQCGALAKPPAGQICGWGYYTGNRLPEFAIIDHDGSGGLVWRGIRDPYTYINYCHYRNSTDSQHHPAAPYDILVLDGPPAYPQGAEVTTNGPCPPQLP